MKAFISYSHNDELALERLHTHLAVLRRHGCIDEWFDREILAGDKIDEEVAERLESYGLFLLLVSPDFLASDYCIEREMKRALERHHLGEARVIPIIIESCDWKSTPLRDLKALPRNGKPVSNWTNKNDAYLDVVQELRRVLEEEEVPDATGKKEVKNSYGITSPETRRYRVKRDFDEIDRSEFREEAFGIIRDFFKSAVQKIDTIEDLRGRFVLLSATSFSCTIVNKAREHGTAHITVHSCNENMGFGDIFYSFSENALPNTANGILSIEADEYELFLNPVLMGFGQHEGRFTPEAAAEQIWEDFIQQAGVTND